MLQRSETQLSFDAQPTLAAMRPFTVKSALLSVVGLLGQALGQQYEAHNRTPASCPDYTEYSQEPHKPLSDGPLALPFMRPSPECRTFNSSAVEVSWARSNLQRPTANNF